MRRLVTTLVALALAVAVTPAASPAVAAPSGPDDLLDRLGVDLDAARAAMARGAERVGPPPAAANAYFQDRPLQWFHPTTDEVTHTQPDGSAFRARILELSDGGGQATPSGHLVTRSEDGWWYYGVRQPDGTIAPTDARAGLDEAPASSASWRMPAEFKASLEEFATYAEQLDAWYAARYQAQAAEARAAGEPVVFKVPALMLAINNTPFQEGSTAEAIQAKYDGIGTSPTGTVTEMYLEQSFGNLVVQVDVYGPYQSAISMNPVNDCWYGTDGGPVLGETLGLGGYGAKGLAAEAVPQADPEVDFSEYDGDGDGYVDFLMIVHSGRGAETTGDPCDVHSHRFGGLAPALVDGAPSEPTPATSDGVLIGQALTVPEIDAGIGVVAHELMHAFGEPDYYGTAGTAGTGDWDLGGGGSYGGVPTQSSPLHFNPLMKMNFGWVDPVRIDDTTRDVRLATRASHPDLLLVPTRVIPEGQEGHEFCTNDPLNTGTNQLANFVDEDGNCLAEGYLLEYMSPTSAYADAESCTFDPADFDRQMYGTGLMVWHYDLSSYEQLGNNNVLRPMLDIEEFDRRDPSQDVERNVTRAEPLDVFWGDPVGISSATAAEGADAVSIAPPDGSPYTVTAPAPTTSATTEAWTAPADVPEGTLMSVTLSWNTQDADDWDLAVQQQVEGDWVEVGSDGAPPASGAEHVEFTVEPGATYRAEAVNYLSASSTAEVAVEYVYDSSIAVKFGPANTVSADGEPTGWSFTNIRPNDYRGTATPLQGDDTIMTLDLIRHDDTTVDVSGDFLHPWFGADDAPARPIVAGEPVTLRTRVYNHGGQAVDGATFAVYDADPATGADPLVTRRTSLDGFGSDVVEVEFTPAAGLNELYVTADAPGDVVPGNDVVRTELIANPAGDASVLVVDNDRGWTQEQTVEASLLALGVDYHVVAGEPSVDTMADYDAVVWLTTGVSGAEGVLSSRAWDDLVAYLDGGGQVWMASNRMAGYAAGLGRAGALAEYFGVVADNNILDPLGDVMIGQGDVIGGEREILMSYIDGRPYLDYFDLASEVEGAAAPKGEAVGLFVHEQRPDKYVGARVDGEGFRTVLTGAPTGIAFGADQLALTEDVLGWFGIATGSADPADTRVRFNRFQHVQAEQPWDVTVGAPSADLAEFVYRIHGDDDWRTVSLDRERPGFFTGVVPGVDVTNNGLDYFVQVVEDGVVRTIDGGAALPNVASGTYGDHEVDYGVCAASQDAPAPDPAPAPAPDEAPLPTTGGGLALLGLLSLAGARAVRRGGRS